MAHLNGKKYSLIHKDRRLAERLAEKFPEEQALLALKQPDSVYAGIRKVAAENIITYTKATGYSDGDVKISQPHFLQLFQDQNYTMAKGWLTNSKAKPVVSLCQ